MKNIKIAFAAVAAIMITASCSSQKATEDDFTTENVEYHDSTKYANVEVKMQLPVGDADAMKAIRRQLISITSQTLRGSVADFTDDLKSLKLHFNAFEGDTTDAKAVIDHYAGQLLELQTAIAKNDYDEEARSREEEAAESKAAEADAPEDSATTLTDGTAPQDSAQGEAAEEEIQPTIYRLTLALHDTTATYATFESQGYEMQSRAAHPNSSIGDGTLTFRLSDGKWIDTFFVAGAEEKMQPLLRAGLTKYFKECGVDNVTEDNVCDQLLLEDDGHSGKVIPLPTCWKPVLAKDGISIIYAQYEIACYAAGMPSFVIPYKDAEPYLTEDVKELVGLKKDM